MNRTAVIHDAHPLWLEAVEGVLERLKVEVSGKATERTAALDLVRGSRPDVFVVEPGTSGIGADIIRQAKQASPGTKVVALADSHDPADVDAAFAAGACAYVFKTAHPDDLASAIRQAFELSIFLAPVQTAGPRLMKQGVREASTEMAPGLTKREIEILQLVSEGHSNGELARMLWVTEQTVKFHLSNIYRKLGVANRTEASRWAQINGLLVQPLVAAV